MKRVAPSVRMKEGVERLLRGSQDSDQAQARRHGPDGSEHRWATSVG